MKYVIFIDGLNREVTVEATSEKDAYAVAWNDLTNEEQDAVVIMDCIDEAA